jgi:hypothetical protein
MLTIETILRLSINARFILSSPRFINIIFQYRTNNGAMQQN